MEFKINTVNKTIEILIGVKTVDFINWVMTDLPDYQEYTIVPIVTYQYYPQYPVVYRDTRVPNTDWVVTCNTSEINKLK